jgi:hypothetical protein
MVITQLQNVNMIFSCPRQDGAGLGRTQILARKYVA